MREGQTGLPEEDDVTDIRERSVVGAVSKVEWDEKGAYVVRTVNGGGYNGAHPYIIITVWAGVMLAKDGGSIASGAQVTIGVSVMCPC